MEIIFLSIIPTTLFYQILNKKKLFKILLSILFYIVIFTIVGLFENIIFNLHCNLADKIGYNNITNLTRIFPRVFGYFFIITVSILMFIIYKTKNTKLFNGTMYSLIFIVLLFLTKFCLGFIYFKIVDITGYNSIYANIFWYFNNCIVSATIVFLAYYVIKR